MKILKTNEDTINYGIKLANKLKAGDILCLHGDLGAGKTTLVKGIATGFKIKEKITSPTFSLMNIYKIKNKQIKNLIHIDTYRLESEEDLIDIGVEDYLGSSDTITIIEWPEKIKKLLENKKTIDITIEHTEDGERIIKCGKN